MSHSLVQTAIDAVRAAGATLRDLAGGEREITSKGFRDDVTDADYAAQRVLIDLISDRHPDAPVVSEENQFGHDIAAWEPPAGTWWVIDPLDGTTNFARGVPHWCTTAAALRGREVVAGAIYDPLRDHLFAVERGAGVTLNGEPLRVTDRSELAQAVVECGLGRNPALRRRGLALFKRLATDCRTVRTFGSAALALAFVAAGWTDAYVHLTLRVWDVAAGGLMVQEAGGVVALPDGTPWHPLASQVFVTNAALHEPLLALVQETLREAEAAEQAV